MWVIVINNVVLVFLFIVQWDHDEVVVTYYQYWSSTVLFCAWYWFYMERELLYTMAMLVLLILRPLVLGFYTLFFQEVLILARFKSSKRRLDIMKLVLASDYFNISFFHGIYKSFYWRFKGKLLWVRDKVMLISLKILTWRREFLLWGVENSGYHYTQSRQLKGVFLYFFQ